MQLIKLKVHWKKNFKHNTSESFANSEIPLTKWIFIFRRLKIALDFNSNNYSHAMQL